MGWSGQRVRELRRKMSWSQADLGRRLNCDSSLIQAWEASELAPESQHLRLLELLFHQLGRSSDEITAQSRADSVMDSEKLTQINHDEIEGRHPTKEIE